MPASRQPDDDAPSLPDDPTLLDDSELMSLFVAYTRFLDWVATNLAEADIAHEQASDQLRVAEAQFLEGNAPTKEDTITQVKARMPLDPQVAAASERRRRAGAVRARVKVAYDRYERGGALLSRELSRRTAGSANPLGRVHRSENGPRNERGGDNGWGRR